LTNELKAAQRLRATFNRKEGTRYLYGAYDVHDDRLFGARARAKTR